MSSTTLPEVKFLGPKDFEEMGLPTVLYKYRRWDNTYHRRIIKEREVYFARPDSFDDPLDCHIPLRYDLLTDDDIMKSYRKDIREQNPGWDDEKVEEKTIIWFNKGLLRDKKRLNELEKRFWQEFNDRFGVFSLTPIPDSKEMWVKYAYNYTGFCVGFKTLSLVKDRQNFGGGGESGILMIYQN